jgi:hypothetical protein
MIGAAVLASRGGASDHVFEIVAAGLLFLGGIRSLVKWFLTDFDAESPRDHVLYSMFASARVGTWLTLGALFLGYAIVSEPEVIPLFGLIPLGLAGVQLLTGMALGRSDRPGPS